MPIWNHSCISVNILCVGDWEIECDFSHVKPNRTIVTKLHNFDYERTISNTKRSMFTYPYESALMKLTQNSTCFQTIDQLCQPWVHRLYEIDRSQIPDDDPLVKRHACRCLRYNSTVRHDAQESNHR